MRQMIYYKNMAKKALVSAGMLLGIYWTVEILLGYEVWGLKLVFIAACLLLGAIMPWK